MLLCTGEKEKEDLFFEIKEANQSGMILKESLEKSGKFSEG